MRVAVGHSDDPDSADAIGEAIAQVRDQLGGGAAQAGFVFVALVHEHDVVLDAIHTAFDGIRLIGCTTDGELSSRDGFQEDSLVLLVLGDAQVPFGIGIGDGVSDGHQQAAETALAQARADLGMAPVLCIPLPTRTTVWANEVVKAVVGVLGPDVPVFGGVAADQWNFDTTYPSAGSSAGSGFCTMSGATP